MAKDQSHDDLPDLKEFLNEMERSQDELEASMRELDNLRHELIAPADAASGIEPTDVEPTVIVEDDSNPDSNVGQWSLFGFDTRKLFGSKRALNTSAPPRKSQAVCEKCGHKNDAQAKFCGGCGVARQGKPANCSNCGHPIDRSANFCTDCGQNVA